MGLAGPLVAVPSIHTNSFELARLVREEASLDAALALIRGAQAPTIEWAMKRVWPSGSDPGQRAEGFDLLCDAFHQVMAEREQAALDALWEESAVKQA